MSSQWVQSKYSKDAEKWEVLQISLGGDDGSHWLVNSPTSSTSSYSLPKSEYLPCDPPEIWVDVTSGCGFVSTIYSNCLDLKLGAVMPGQFVHFIPNYRLRKVEVSMVGPCIPNGCEKQHAFIVEKKKP